MICRCKQLEAEATGLLGEAGAGGVVGGPAAWWCAVGREGLLLMQAVCFGSAGWSGCGQATEEAAVRRGCRGPEEAVYGILGHDGNGGMDTDYTAAGELLQANVELSDACGRRACLLSRTDG